MVAASVQVDKVMDTFLRREASTILTAAISDTTGTSISFQVIVQSIGLNSVLQIEQELFKVTSVDNTAGTANVIRGWLGSTAATHAINTPIYVDPRVERDDILDLFNDCLVDIVPTLYQTATKEFSYSTSTVGYDLAVSGGILEVIRVMGEADSNAKDWQRLHDWEIDDDAQAADFPTGPAIMLRTALPSSAKFRVTYSTGFTALTAETEDLSTAVGLKAYMNDLLFYFAMSRLLVKEEVKRSQIESAQSHQRAQDVPGFLALRTGEWYQARYNDRLRSAATRLRKETRRSIGTGYGS